MDFVLICVVLFLILVASFFWGGSHKFDHWEQYGIPTVPASYPFGSQTSFFNTALQDVELERHKKYGRLYGYYEGTKPVLSIAEPDLLRDIFVKDFQYFTTRRQLLTGDNILKNFISVVTGEDWKRLRTIISPAFTSSKIKKMTSIILTSAKSLTDNFDKLIKANEPLNVKRYFGAFTMDVIASTAFATKLDSHNDPNNKFVGHARNIFASKFPWRFILNLFFPMITKLFNVSIFPPASTSFFANSTLAIIEQRKRTGQRRNDFLQLLLDASKEDGSWKIDDAEIPEEERIPTAKLTNKQKSLTLDELLSQCVIFFLAAYDTTASTLSFACYELALNTDCQDRLIEEIDSTLAKHQGEITYETVQDMKYIDTVIYETLRKYPPVIRLDRTADDDYLLGDTGITLKKGALIGVPAYAMHHDPEFYPDPEKFIPERFTAEGKASRNPYTYLPFGQGPRNCIGMRFAVMEMKLCLTHVFRNFRLKRTAQTKVPLEYQIAQNLLQPKEITLSIERRPEQRIQQSSK